MVVALPGLQPRQAQDGVDVGDLHALDAARADKDVVGFEVEHDDAVPAAFQDVRVQAASLAQRLLRAPSRRDVP